MIILHYKTKKALKESIGKPLRYTETSIFRDEVSASCVVCGSNHPKRSWYASITVEDGIIKGVK